MSFQPRTGPDREPDPDDLAPFEGWTFATDERGDLRLTEMNQIAITHNGHAVRQALLTALGTVKGEDPLDEDFGLDVFEATRSIPHLRREIARTLLHDDKEHERVDQVDEVKVYRRGSRDAEVRVTASLDSGGIETLVLAVGGVTN